MAGPMDYLAGLSGVSMSNGAALIKDYLKTGGANLNPEQLAWCAAAVNASLAKAGMQGTGSNMARSFMGWGQPVQQPQRGDIAVFTRGDPNGPSGHVGFFDGYDEKGRIKVLGGNQSDGVNVTAFDPATLLGFRRGEGMTLPAEAANAGAPQVATGGGMDRDRALMSLMRKGSDDGLATALASMAKPAQKQQQQPLQVQDMTPTQDWGASMQQLQPQVATSLAGAAKPQPYNPATVSLSQLLGQF